ncbi:MAG: hypothetical protein ABI037_09925 [Gemmatimonadales bacterium]
MKRDLLAWMCVLAVMASPADAQNRAERSAECLKDGDSKTSSKLARRVVNYGAERWQLAEWATSEDRNQARSELYDFLKHKLGGPSAICAQYISTGDGHFRRGYADEAVAALVGLKLPGDGHKNFAIPRKVAHKLAEEALFGAIWTACTGLEAMPSGNQLEYGRKAKARDITEGPVGPYTNNPSGQASPQDPTLDPNTNKTAIHGDANAGPQDMKECEEKARKAAQGAADFIITGDVGFDIPSTERYDVKDKLLNALILSYRYRRLDAAARDLIGRAVARYGLSQPGGAGATAAAAVNTTVLVGGAGGSAAVTPRDQLVALLYRLYRYDKVSPSTILAETSPLVPEAAAARIGVKFIVDRPVPPADKTTSVISVRLGAPPFATVPADLATPAVVSAFTSVGVTEAAPGTEILVQQRVALAGAPVTALVSAYKSSHGIPESSVQGGRAPATPAGARLPGARPRP